MGIFYRLFLLVLFMTLSLSASAQESESERALADKITARITKALGDGPYTVEQTCDSDNCVITLQME